MTIEQPRIAGIGTAVPAHRITQCRAKELAGALFDDGVTNLDRMLAVFDRSGVRERFLCVEEAWFAEPHSFEERNAVYETEALALSLRSARRAMAIADVAPDDIGAVFYVSSTGFATPSLDSRLQQELGLPQHGVTRDATFGHGCAGGVGALGRAASWCRGNPGKSALVVATELCSLTFQLGQQSSTNVVAASLFSDGSAAAVIGPDGRGPQLVGHGSYLWPQTEEIMGWSHGSDGFEVILSRRVPAFLRRHVAESLEPVCRSVDISIDDLRHLALHPGGSGVIRALCEGLDVDECALRYSVDTLARFGNMSSPTALFVLDRHLRCGSMRPGEYGVVSAMGPGFAAEHVLFKC